MQRDIMLRVQYTIRNIPPEVDRALRARAKQLGKSVNQLALEMLTQSIGHAIRYRNLRKMPGSWTKQDATRFDEFLSDHRQIDEGFWK